MATINTNGTGGGNWADTATWAGGVVPVYPVTATVMLGDTIEEVPSGEECDVNYGTVTTNNGTVTTNNGTVVTNGGTVTTSYGTVATNNGTVTTNDYVGAVKVNYGTVTTNNGTVTTNNGTVTTNNGTVVTNNDTITTNNGIIYDNGGTISGGTGIAATVAEIIAAYAAVTTDLAKIMADATAIEAAFGVTAGLALNKVLTTGGGTAYGDASAAKVLTTASAAGTVDLTNLTAGNIMVGEIVNGITGTGKMPLSRLVEQATALVNMEV